MLLITNADILKVLGKNLKQARKNLKYTQEFVSESVNISIDLLRNIENGRNVGSVPTLLNLCNFLKVSPNKLFGELLEFEESTLDSTLKKYLTEISSNDKKILLFILTKIINFFLFSSCNFIHFVG